MGELMCMILKAANAYLVNQMFTFGCKLWLSALVEQLGLRPQSAEPGKTA